MNRYCIECGKERNATGSFCTTCGVSFAEIPTGTSPLSDTAFISDPLKRSGRGVTKPLIILGAAGLTLIGAYAGFTSAFAIPDAPTTIASPTSTRSQPTPTVINAPPPQIVDSPPIRLPEVAPAATSVSGVWDVAFVKEGEQVFDVTLQLSVTPSGEVSGTLTDKHVKSGKYGSYTVAGTYSDGILEITGVHFIVKPNSGWFLDHMLFTTVTSTEMRGTYGAASAPSVKRGEAEASR